jgi:hypothetical protein
MRILRAIAMRLEGPAERLHSSVQIIVVVLSDVRAYVRWKASED